MSKFEIDDFRNRGGLTTIRRDVPDDFFIVCASYEFRSISMVKSLASDYRVKHGIIYVNKEFLRGVGGDITKSNIEQMKEILEEHSENVELIEGSWLDPKEQITAIRKSLRGHMENSEEIAVTLDTTTFNREALIVVSLLLRQNFPDANLRTIYVSPNDHGDWLSRGFRSVRNIMGFPGIQSANLPTLLVVLSGFEPERTIKIIEEHEPIKVLLGVGLFPTSQKFLERNIDDHKLVLSRQEVEKFCFPVTSIKDCWECLEKLIQPYLGKYNIVLAPMSTKLSTTATFLTAEHYPEIQLTYCLPGEYNLTNYSNGEKAVYIETMPFKAG